MNGDRMSRQHARHGLAKSLPLFGAPEIVHHQKSAAQQILAQPRCFRVTQIPPAGLRRIHPRIIEQVVVGESHVPRIARRNAREPLDALRKVIVRIRPIHHPPAFASGPARCESKKAMIFGQIRVFRANEVKLSRRREHRTRTFFFLLLKSESLAHARHCEQEGQQQRKHDQSNSPCAPHHAAASAQL
jgi:hypothetical protein